MANDAVGLHPPKNLERRIPNRRLIYLVGFSLLLLSAAYGFKYFWLERPTGFGPAGPGVDRAMFEFVWSDADVLLVGLGDSITDGLGSMPGSKSYFNRLVQTPVDDAEDMAGICLSAVLPNLRHENYARGGTTSLENLEYLLP